MISGILSVLWLIIKIVFFTVFFVQSISFAIAYYEIANTRERKEIPSIMEVVSTFFVELFVAFINILIFPLGYIEPDPLREINSGKKSNPVILVHGYFMSRACFILLYLRMRQAGKRDIFTINLRPRTAPIEDLAHQLSEKIEEVIVLTKSDKVNIIGHSMGGIVSRYYIDHMNGAKKVNKLITIGTPHNGTKMAVFGFGANAREMIPGSGFMKALNSTPLSKEVKFYSIWSTMDNLVLPQESSVLPEPGINIKFYSMGHLTLLFSPRVFLKIMEILEDSSS
jgi:triacylglycerol esterase/lipase EstA (alpha/beta hydrolase family)